MNARLLKIVALAALFGLTLVALQTQAAEKGKSGLPADAKGFAGMVAGKVAIAGEGKVMVEVTKINKVWKHSKAKNPESLIGQKVAVVPTKEGRHAKLAVRYLASLKVGEEVVLDAANKSGNALTLLELTKDQLERVEKESK